MNNNTQKQRLGKPIEILYVEDDPSSFALVRRILEADGCHVLGATDGLSALEAAAAVEPDLILMDIAIGGLDGYEVTTRLTSDPNLKKIPIVAITAATLSGDRERALIAGCAGYVPKPINVDTFSDQVRSYLSGVAERIESAEDRAEYLTEYNTRLVDRLEEKIRELEVSNQELQLLDKMKSDFIILAGHELRTPLSVIYGYAQMLQMNTAIPGSQNDETSPQGIVKSILHASSRLNHVITDILNVSLIDANRLELAMEPVFLKTAVYKAIKDISMAARDRDLRFETQGLEDLAPVRGDAERLYQVLWNIISNAVKYTPDGGFIRVFGETLDGAVHISVQDTGIGFPQGHSERIFDRFYVLEDTMLHRSSKTAFRGGGLGLGLTVAKGIVAAHGGRVWAESEGYDEERLLGSTLHVLLPTEKDESQERG